MEKEFVIHPLALRMKELGFNEPCFAFFNGKYHDWLIDDNNGLNSPTINPNKDIGRCVKRPTYSQAFRWFREKHELETDIIFHTDYLKNGDKNVYEVNIQNKVSNELHLITPLNGFKTYEEAELACLEKLIEIVEQQKTE